MKTAAASIHRARVLFRRSPCGRGTRAGVMLGLLMAVTSTGTARGQFGGGGGFGFMQPVGGISVDTDGIVRAVDDKLLDESVRKARQAVATADLPAAPTDMRHVSLARIVAAVRKVADQKASLPPDLLLLGGLERVTHLFVVPEMHDIVMAGPADRPAVAADGTPVAQRSGRPLLRLEDFIVALRSIELSRGGGILCSIDPTPEGLARLQEFLSRQKTMGRDPRAVFRGMEEALGPQVVTVGGVPADSRFARVLVGADHAMKRIGMGHEPSGVKELPSYLSMVRPGGRSSSLPRFWLEAEYEPLARDANELTWRIGDRRMKCLSANDGVGAVGIQRGVGAPDDNLDAWCRAMTEHYDRLTPRHPVFAELVNCVDLAVVAALIRGRQLDERAGCDLRPLLDDRVVPLPRYDAATRSSTIANGLKKGSNWVLSASGGVLVHPWRFAGNVRRADDLSEARTAATARRPETAAATAAWWD
jgi:hypothetical protein